MGAIKTTEYVIIEEGKKVPKAMYVNQYDSLGLLAVTPAHMVFIDGKQTEVNNERDAKRMIIGYSIDKAFYRVSTSNEDEELYLGAPKQYTEEDMIKVLPPGQVYSFEKIDNPLL